LKYLIIVALVGVAFVFVYSRLRPYLKLIQKVVSTLNVSTGIDSASVSSRNRAGSRDEHRLVRCASCGTWIPAERAMNLSSGLATYCSRDCLEKKSTGKERKLAG
jgi:hypothetical protein